MEREEAIRLGLIDDPNTPRRLEDAIDFRGTCESMCPDFELVEREVQHMLDPLEKVIWPRRLCVCAAELLLTRV